MSPPRIAITDDDIAYAESILLQNGGSFDDERRAFIKCLRTIDLQAVPGSGKTTALLAKLVILERYLPFEDSSGILVLSHTNAAIDEIAHRIGKYCPKLFLYPNFVGTIQSFVDTFFAIPYYTWKWGKRPYVIDGDAYQERASRFCQCCLTGFSRQEQKNAKYYLNLRRIATTYRLSMRNGTPSVIDEINGSELDFSKPKGRIKADNYVDFSETEKQRIGKWLIKFKRRILVDDGVLHYDDAYFLADRCLTRYPKVRDLLRRRFRYGFVDEMQDMDKHQHDLLERLFFDNGTSGCIYQRIGDKNQAIFSGKVKLDNIWSERETTLPLTGSHRLPPSIAQVVEPFATVPMKIKGRNTSNTDGTANVLLPHIIVYNDDSASGVIDKFCELIKRYRLAGEIPDHPKYPVKAIAWVKGDRGLQQYWKEYQPEAVKSKLSHSCLKSYVAFAYHEEFRTNGLRPIHKKIMDGILKILHLEGIRNPNSRNGYFSMPSLLKYLRETNRELYDDLRRKSFSWTRDVYAGRIDHTYDDIKEFVPALLESFGKQLNNATDFVTSESTETASSDTTTSERLSNTYQCPVTGIQVHVGTVHSAKGETHTATLYLESYYHNDGGKSYESQRLLGQFAGTPLSSKTGKRVKQSARMVYVGFSRPTHLLCFAVHKDRFDETAFPGDRWKIVNDLVVATSAQD